MRLWVLIVLVGLIKVPIAVLLLWFPMRSDEAMRVVDQPGGADDDGGSAVDPGGGRPDPHHPLRGPRSPRRRGPHGSPALPSPPRVRGGTRPRSPQRLRLR